MRWLQFIWYGNGCYNLWPTPSPYHRHTNTCELPGNCHECDCWLESNKLINNHKPLLETTRDVRHGWIYCPTVLIANVYHSGMERKGRKGATALGIPRAFTVFGRRAYNKYTYWETNMGASNSSWPRATRNVHITGITSASPWFCFQIHLALKYPLKPLGRNTNQLANGKRHYMMMVASEINEYFATNTIPFTCQDTWVFGAYIIGLPPLWLDTVH